MNFFLGCLELLIGRLQLLVDREQIFVGCDLLGIGLPQLFNGRLQRIARYLELLRQLLCDWLAGLQRYAVRLGLHGARGRAELLKDHQQQLGVRP